MEREASIGGILSQTFETVSAAGRAVLIYTLILGVFSGLGGLFGLASVDDSFLSARIRNGGFDTDTIGLVNGLFETASLVLFVIASYLLLKQMLVAIGRSPAAGSRFWSFLLMSILAIIGMVLGAFVFFIPAIILLVKWSAANGFVLTGKRGITESLGESWSATSGHGLSIFVAGLLLWLFMMIIGGMAVGMIVAIGVNADSGLFSPITAIAVALSSFVESFNYAISFAFSIAVFHLVAPADTSVADVFE